jgi:hypothetical protein
MGCDSKTLQKCLAVLHLHLPLRWHAGCGCPGCEIACLACKIALSRQANKWIQRGCSVLISLLLQFQAAALLLPDDQSCCTTRSLSFAAVCRAVLLLWWATALLLADDQCCCVKDYLRGLLGQVCCMLQASF